MVHINIYQVYFLIRERIAYQNNLY